MWQEQVSRTAGWQGTKVAREVGLLGVSSCMSTHRTQTLLSRFLCCLRARVSSLYKQRDFTPYDHHSIVPSYLILILTTETMGELYEHRKTYLPPDLGHFDSPSSRKVPIQPAATIEDSARELQPAGLDNKAFGYATLRPQRVPYQKIWRTTQAGPAIVAVKDVEPLPIVLMKTEKRTANLNLTNLRKASDPHILQLLDFFWDWDNVTLVYEYEHSAASLARLLNAGVRFSEVDIATICHGVLEGLLYIHSVLGIC